MFSSHIEATSYTLIILYQLTKSKAPRCKRFFEISQLQMFTAKLCKVLGIKQKPGGIVVECFTQDRGIMELWVLVSPYTLPCFLEQDTFPSA